MSRRAVADPVKQLNKAAAQVQSQLKASLNTAQLDALAAYFTLVEPNVRGEDFCVALARSTFLFHLQMERVAEADADLYVSLITKVCTLITSDQHPFVQTVLKQDVFGLALHGHSVVLLPMQQYNALSYLAAELVIRECIPRSIITAWVRRLEHHATARSPLVSLRSQMLLVKTSPNKDDAQDLAELQRIIHSRPTKMNLDLLLLSYERLQRLVPDPAQGNMHGRALSILASSIFLKLRSPIRKHYVETYLYPSLMSPDMANFADNEDTKRHLSSLLLRQCTPGMQPGSPYYMCQCAIIQDSLSNQDNVIGAMTLATLMDWQMPHAAYFINSLAVDPRMDSNTFVSMLMYLNRSAAHVMAGRSPASDPIAAVVSNPTTMVYNVIFSLRDIARHCAMTATKRASDLLQLMRGAIPLETVRAMGTFANQAFEGRCDISIEPQLLCAELGMLLHNHEISAAMDTCMDYFKQASSPCHRCGAQKSSSLVCPVSGDVHLTDRAALSRILSTVSDCAGNEPVQNKMIELLRSPSTQLLPATHFFLYHLLSHAGQHRGQLLTILEPHIRSILVSVADADAVNTVPSDVRASILVVHTKIVNFFPQDPLQLQSTIKIMGGLALRCEHDALALFWVAHKLLRIGKANVELMAIDPQETHYGQEVPGTAPSSYAAADNAQLLLQMLTRAHSYNDVTRKLVGASVCKLIQDFNVQAPNIVSSLLNPIGFLPNSLGTAAAFGFPCSPESNFWHFVLLQMKKSAPARTAFIATATRCVATRFRNESPISAVTVGHADPSTHLFVIGFFACMRRNAQMARIVSYCVSEWVRMKGHKPGKFACLLYMCCQVSLSIVQEEADIIMPTAGERTLYTEAVAECTKALSEATGEAQRLLPMLHENPAFQHLLSRIIQSAQVLTGDASRPTSDAVAPMPLDNDVFANEIGAAFTEESMALSLAQVGLQDIGNAADDALFDDNDGPDGDDFDDQSYPNTMHNNVNSMATAAINSQNIQPTVPVSTLSTRSASSVATTRSTQHGTASTKTTTFSSNPTTLDTIMPTESTYSSGPQPSAPQMPGWAHVHLPVKIDERPPVTMPAPPAQMRDEASQTSPHQLVNEQSDNSDSNEKFQHAPRLPRLQAHHQSNAAPSDAVFEYLMTHQDRASALEDLHFLQAATTNNYHTPHTAYRAPPETLVMQVNVDEPNSYDEPHRPRQAQAGSSSVMTRMVAHPMPNQDFTPYTTGTRRDGNSSSGNKRQREEAEMNTPNQPILDTPWRYGMDSGRNDIRSMMAELGVARHDESQGPKRYLPLPRSAEEHQRNMAAYHSTIGMPNGNLASFPPSYQPSMMSAAASHPAAPSNAGASAPAQSMTVFAHSVSLPAVPPQQPLHPAFFNQHSGDALREVRQVMGAGNPNTSHTMSGRAKKEPLGSNALYNIGQPQGQAVDNYYALM